MFGKRKSRILADTVDENLEQQMFWLFIEQSEPKRYDALRAAGYPLAWDVYGDAYTVWYGEMIMELAARGDQLRRRKFGENWDADDRS